MKLLLMTAGHGDVLLAEGDPEIDEDAERLVEEFRRQLDLGMWAAVPTAAPSGRHEATMVRDFTEVPAGTEQVIFFPPAAGGAARAVSVEAEQRARELLRSTAGDEVFAMFEDLGFVAVEPADEERYAYLIYAQRPIVAYRRPGGELLNEYCVRFDERAEKPRRRLPDADDVLAKWLALSADERHLLAGANVDPPGRQLDPDQVSRDVGKLAMWRASRGEATDREQAPA